MTNHIPVLLNETIEGLNIKPDGVYVDLTLGRGGHSKEVLNALQLVGLFPSIKTKPRLMNQNKI